MVKECSIVKDLLSLYVEGMLSEETTEYVKEHLNNCKECMTILNTLQQTNALDLDVDVALTDENKDTIADAVPLKKIKQKMKRKRLLTVFATIVCTFLTVIIATNLKPATIDYGNSKLYSMEDREEAVSIIKNKINSWKGCKLYSINFTSDELCQRELAYCIDLGLAKAGTTYEECMVFRSRFRSPIFGGGSWNDNYVYDWSWYLARTENGNWELLTWGAP